MKQHLTIGKEGEVLARKYLFRHNFEILECNWRFGRAEIDLIVKKEDELIFCEVKTRTNTFYGSPERFVSLRKKQLMADAASEYVRQKGHLGDIRFDIIAIVMKNQFEYKIRHLKDAFFPGIHGF